jgi:hypothetical protein
MRIAANIAVWVGLVVASVAFASDPLVDQSLLEGHAKKMGVAAGAGWLARVEGGRIVVERTEAVEMRSTTPSQPAGGFQPVTRKPMLILMASPTVTQAKLAALQKANADRAKAMEMLASQMKDMPSNSKPMTFQDGYRASNPDQQARLDAYIAVNKALPYQQPPVLFAVDAAFYWGDDWYVATDPNVQAEMQAIRKKIEALYSDKPLR